MSCPGPAPGGRRAGRWPGAAAGPRDRASARIALAMSGFGAEPSAVLNSAAIIKPGPRMSAISGVRTAEQLRDNVGATGWRLEGEPLKRLNEVSDLPDRYPESFEKTMVERRESALKMPSLTEEVSTQGAGTGMPHLRELFQADITPFNN